MLRAAFVTYLTLTSGMGPLLCCCAVATSGTSSIAPRSRATTTHNCRESSAQRTCRHHGGLHAQHSHGSNDGQDPIPDGTRAHPTPSSPEPCELPCECGDSSVENALVKARRGLASDTELGTHLLWLGPIFDIIAMPKPQVLDYPGRFENATFPFLTARGILRALQTFRC
jgi:hypothetical protein